MKKFLGRNSRRAKNSPEFLRTGAVRRDLSWARELNRLVEQVARTDDLPHGSKRPHLFAAWVG